MIWVYLLVGVVACSSSALFIKSCEMDPALLGAVRLYIASALLIPIFIRDLKKFPEFKIGKLIKTSFPAGFFLALHFISWNDGVRRTLVVHASLIVNMVPVVLPIVLWLTHREKVNRSEVFATIISLMGVALLAHHDYHFSKEYVIGDIVCFGSMVLFAVYLSFGRKHRGVGSLILYILPVYVISATICLIACIPKFSVMPLPSGHDYLMAFCLAVIPTIFGHTLINLSMRHLRGQVVGIVNVGQFISAGILAYFVFGEVPKSTFYLVSLFVVLSCIMVVWSHRKDSRS